MYINPPYSQLLAWVRHGVGQLVSHRGHLNQLWLVPARTDTRAGQLLLGAAQSVCFIKGRLKFIEPDTDLPSGNSAPFPSMLVYAGNDRQAARFDEHFRSLGTVMDNFLNV